jgi:hypothetical protein
MIKLTNRTAAFVAMLSLVLLASPSWGPSAQERRLVYENWYGETKKELSAHYTGKTVKLRMAIPNTRRGLELTDGEVQPNDFTQTQAQPGDEVTIKGVKVGANNIELLLNKTGGKRPNRLFGWMKRPRINLRFSRELTAKDMTVENVNRWLAAAIDVAPLTSLTAEQSANHPQPLIASVAETAPKSMPTDTSQSLPTASVTGDLTPASPNFGELTVESSTSQARIYIDNAYSGFAPRTVRLRAGVHSVLVMANGYTAWEQRLFIPGGKASVVKAELQR